MTLRAIPIDQFFAEVEETRERRYGPVGELTTIVVTEEALRKRRHRKQVRRNKMEATCRCGMCYEYDGRKADPGECGMCRETSRRLEPKPEDYAEEALIGMARVTWEQALDVVLSELRDLMIAKHKDYGPGNIREFGELGVLVRSSDKVHRLKNLIMVRGAETAVDEPLEDSWKDLANYGVIALMLRKGVWELPMEEA